MTELSLDEVAQAVVRQIADRLEESVAWHEQHGSAARRDRLLDLAAKLEKQRFNRLADMADRKGQETTAEFWESIRDEVLPAIVHDLRRRH